MKAARLAPDRTRRIRVAALAALAAFVLAPGQGPHVHSSSGEVEIGRGEPPAWRPAQAGDALAPGDAVRTGHDGRAELDLGSSRVRLYGNSLLRLPAEALGSHGAQAVELERGDSLFDVLQRGAEDRFDVRTREVVVSVKGTRFSVAAGDVVQVAVYEGVVGLLAREAERVHETLVREGFAAFGSRERPFELFLHQAADPWQSWAPDALPQRLPERLLHHAPPARAALESAHLAARRSFESEALAAAVRRRPEVAERVARLAAERRAAAEQSLRKGERPEEELRTASLRDPILDVSRHERKQRIQVPFAEAWMASQAAGGAGAAGGSSLPFDITLLDGSGVSGPDKILLEFQDGSSWSFEEGFLEDVLAGEEVLPQTLLDLLQAQGIGEIDAFVALLVGMLEDF